MGRVSCGVPVYHLYQSREDTKPHITVEDPEVKRSYTLSVTAESTKQTAVVNRLDYFSDWTRAVRAMALCLRYIYKLRHRVSLKQGGTKENQATLSVMDLQQAKVEIFRQIQKEAISQELKDLSKSNHTTMASKRERVMHLKCTSCVWEVVWAREISAKM